jgi:hypothetical protein
VAVPVINGRPEQSNLISAVLAYGCQRQAAIIILHQALVGQRDESPGEIESKTTEVSTSFLHIAGTRPVMVIIRVFDRVDQFGQDYQGLDFIFPEYIG